MDRFVALVEELEGMEWVLDCLFQLEAMTIPPHVGQGAPDPLLESLGHHLLPPNPEKNHNNFLH